MSSSAGGYLLPAGFPADVTTRVRTDPAPSRRGLNLRHFPDSFAKTLAKTLLSRTALGTGQGHLQFLPRIYFCLNPLPDQGGADVSREYALPQGQGQSCGSTF